MIAFRLDADARIGAGHFFRSFSLALALKKAKPGVPVRFYGKIEGAGLMDRLLAEGFGHSPEDGIGESADLLVVDHYGIDKDWEYRAREKARKILVIDDLANRVHDCDFLLDQNFLPASRYTGLIPRGAKLLCGPSYSLLRPEFLAKRKESLARDRSRVRKVFVCFGGADQPNQTARVVRLLEGPEFEVMVGPANPHRKELEAMAGERVRVHADPSDVSTLMAGCDLAVVSGGSIQWELSCLGVPVLSMSIAGNQEPIAKALGDQGYCVYAGPHAKTSDEEIIRQFAFLLADAEKRKILSEKSSILVDGLGVQRVADEVLKVLP